MRQLIYQLKNGIISLRVSILSVFTILFVISILLILTITYFRFSSILTFASKKLMNDVSSVIFQRISHQVEAPKAEISYTVRLIQSGVINYNNPQALLATTYSLLVTRGETLPNVKSVFWADEKGNFVITREKSANDPIIYSEIINKTSTPYTRTVFTYLPNNKLSKQVYTKDITYDPRLRFWYQDTKRKKTTNVSGLFQYFYFGIKFWGFTISEPVFINGNFIGAFSVHLGIDSLRKYIEEIQFTKNDKIFIVSTTGKLVAFPHMVQFQAEGLKDIHSLKDAEVVKSFDLFQQSKKEIFIFKYNQENYVANYVPVPLFGNDLWYVGVVVPERDFIGELIKTNYIILGISFLILILALLIVSKIISDIVRPLNKLSKETDSIKDFHLEDDIKIKSRIKEVMQLTNALNSMKKGLRSFQKYVPANLVRQLISAGEDARVGGAKKEIVILFSDVKDFTTIAEFEDPEQLMIHLCDYFDELSHIIIQEHGTIDKFMGDSIMAFWGAPLNESMLAQRSAMAAIKCLNRTKELNLHWKSKGIPPFITRFGIHLGDAIVGNLGSSERLNYTAIGDVINIASRLEGINKIYGTSIIVSERIYQALNNEFILRMVDLVALKGRVEKSFIYELLGFADADIGFNVNDYQDSFQKGFHLYQNKQWKEAIHFFKECLLVYPKDTVAKVFIKRCEHYYIKPPKKWDGAFHINIK